MKIIFFTENSYAGGLDSIIINLIDQWPSERDVDNNPDELVLICNRSHPGLEKIANRTGKPIKIVPHTVSYTHLTLPTKRIV